MWLLKDIFELVTMQGAAKKQGRKTHESDLSVLAKASVLVDKGRVVWIGSLAKMPKEFRKKIKKETSHKTETILPGFVECHTHTVFAGSRAFEFEQRLRGVSYQEISAGGGGIQSTMRETRKLTAGQLAKISQPRVNEFLKQGVTTLEIKSGYGLSLKEEIKILQSMDLLKGPRIQKTFLGAHSIPAETADSLPSGAKREEVAAKYLQQYRQQWKKIRQQADRVDIWVEKNFFEEKLAKEFLIEAQSHGFKIAIHADQLTLSGGADLGVALNALSVDHVLQIEEEQIFALANSDTVAVLLPAADYYMKCAYPPARELIDAGATVALATDFNPGTSPTYDINFVGSLARLEMHMTLPEVIAAYTVGSAKALGILSDVGSIECGKFADLASIDGSWRDLFLNVGDSRVLWSSLEGKRLFKRK